MTLIHRHITLRFKLGQGQSFGTAGDDTVEISGLRCSVSITKAGGYTQAHCDAKIYGLTLDVMNKLTRFGSTLLSNTSNEITVLAADDEMTPAMIFQGIISEAWADLNASPEAAFTVAANTGVIDALKPIQPTSIKGNVDGIQVLASLASQLTPPRTLENNSKISIQISNMYFSGTALDQIQQIAQAGNFQYLMDEDAVLAIWPQGDDRKLPVVEIAADKGMVGYPTFTNQGIQVTTLYNPAIKYGCSINVTSILKASCGKWILFNVGHDLEAETVNGKWFTHIQASRSGLAVDQ